MDASYVHRNDYRELMLLATSAYPDFGKTYRECLVNDAKARLESGTAPPSP